MQKERKSPREEVPTDTLVAEHGLSLLVTIYQGTKTHTILFDTGYSQIGVPHNIVLLGIELQGIEGTTPDLFTKSLKA
jgi:7,8-dihydropterin-6-yl-methyl-4-(beta-D-ribofuranosyl)aminobenzene 5'-phosphate synthase